jgi:hypothetical protein
VRKLKRLEARIKAHEDDAIQARWESGRELLALRHASKLPNGLKEELGIEDTESRRRMRFAELYPTEELFRRFRLNSPPGWYQIYKSFPPKNPKKAGSSKAGGSKSTKPKMKEPTKKDIADAQSVIKKLAQPGVRAVIKSAAADDALAHRAQVIVNRQEKEEDRRQKDEDKQRQEVWYALRRMLVEGDQSWENLTEQINISNDTVQRYLKFMLPIPNSLRLKILVDRLGRLQQSLFDLRKMLAPDYQGEPTADISETTGGIITIDPK